MNSFAQSKKYRIGFMNNGNFQLKGGAVSMSVINWSLRLSSFNINIKINKNTKDHSNSIERAIRQERACEQAFAFKNNAETMFHLSNILK